MIFLTNQNGVYEYTHIPVQCGGVARSYSTNETAFRFYFQPITSLGLKIGDEAFSVRQIRSICRCREVQCSISPFLFCRMEQFAVLREVAPAIYGSILLCKDKASGNLVIVKRVQIATASKHKALSGPTVQEDIHVEKHVYRVVQKHGGHRNVLPFLNAFEQDGHEHFVLEYCAAGDLFNLLRNAPHQRFPAAQASHYFRHVVQGISFLHSIGIAHGDISLENILVGQDDTCKLMDFGLAVESTECRRPVTAAGKFFYMPPEMFASAQFDAMKADMWSLGILLVVMLTGMPPFGRATSSDNVFVSFETYGIRTLLRGWKVSHYFSSDAMDLVEMLLVASPQQRLSIQDVLHHPYLATRSSHNPTIATRMSSTSTSMRESFLESSTTMRESSVRGSMLSGKDDKKRPGSVRRFFQKIFGKSNARRDPSEVTVDMDNQEH
ncbi:Aste57867_20812 [Aphanomyces stellatus]|uniref:Aste57867_20812 protein n=1 Tax=Aphanomyces stellatus TaxID=120398 RepID=A0A485LGH5_9STRA|nr:hypothetical protein As57867_020744 [Aphanomyces stellatus]VFT97491.1 Aste57867_20812 [Aphanomyces stellatus]